MASTFYSMDHCRTGASFVRCTTLMQMDVAYRREFLFDDVNPLDATEFVPGGSVVSVSEKTRFPSTIPRP